MGKNSLVQSTTKGKKSAAKKKTAKKIAAKAKAKAAPKAKVAAKPKVAPKPKAAPKAKAAAAPKKEKVSVKDLLKKKFSVWKPEKLYSVAPDKGDAKDFTAPPFVSGPEAEQKRIKELLLKKYDLAEIKAAGEKAAAGKAAAEKAAAENAAAENAAAEKAAAENAAAENAAAEKAAAEKADEPEVSVSYEPPDSDDTIPSDPMEKGMKYLAAAVAILIVLVIGSSMINQGKYYIHSTDGALEIFQGSFAPMGEKLLISLPGVQQPAKAKDIYSQTDVYPLIFNYYVEKADFLRLDNMSVGYNFNLKEESYIKRLRISLAGQNLFTITGYDGVDPDPALQDGGDLGDLQSEQPNVLVPGIERREAYFTSTTVTVGLNINF